MHGYDSARLISRSTLACQVVLEEYFNDAEHTPVSMDLLISGSIPPGSGMSSSAALIIASLTAILLANSLIPSSSSSESQPRVSIANHDLVALARSAEAKLGVKSGGMDQSASVFGIAGAGLYISFYPSLEAEIVNLPTIRHPTSPGLQNGHKNAGEELVLVIANSLSIHSLADDAKKHYNLRVLETLLGARILANKLGLIDSSSMDLIQLREVVELYVEGKALRPRTDEGLAEALDLILKDVDTILGSNDEARTDGHSAEEIFQLSGMDADSFDEAYLHHIEVDTLEQSGRFRLYNRVRHVFEEAARVLAVKQLCIEEAAAIEKGIEYEHEEDLPAERIGKLLWESHESCRDLYECSNDHLNELWEVCKKAGSLGSRLSG